MASHRAAALLWKLPGGADVLEITSPRWRRTRHEDIVVHETRRFDAIDVTVLDGMIPVTRPARTVLDLCGLAERGLLAESVVEAALQEAIRRDLIDVALIGARCERLGGDVRVGGKIAARLIDRWLPAASRTDSRAEAILFDLLVEAGLPEPVPQFRVWLGPGEFVTLDFAWPDARIGLEFDSYRWHGGRMKHDADARRELRLGEQDWSIVRVTDDELDAGCPHAIPNLKRQLRVAA
jgi:very-short-patch-repair endonuclease